MTILQIEFKGTDEVRPIVANISAEINTLNETTVKAKESGTGFFSGMLQTASGFLAANVIGGITSQISGFISSGIADARESNQLMAQTQAVITSTGGAAGVSAQQVADFASNLSAAAGKSLFGDAQIQASENLLLTFTNVKGKILEGATAISVDMAQALGGAPKDAAIQLGKALNDPEKGISALTRVGVTFTETQKNQIKALQEMGDTAGAQAIILKELNTEFGGSAAAAAKADGGMAQFKDSMGELAEKAGGVLLPILGQLAGFASANLIPVVSKLVDWFGDNLPIAISYVSTTVIPALIGAWQTIQPAVQTVIAGVQTMIAAFSGGGAASDGLASKVSDLADIWQQLQPVITNVVNAVSNVVNAVFGQIQTFIAAHGADISATMQDAWQRIMVIIKLGIELYNAIVPPVLNFIAGFIREHGAQIQQILGNTWTSIKALIDGALTLIEGVIRVALDLIHGNWSQAWADIQTMSARIVQDLWQIIKGGLDTIAALFGSTLNQVAANFTTFVTQTVPSFGRGLIDGIISGITSGIGALESAIENAAQAALNAAKHALGISSPSKVFADQIGLNITSGIAMGITNGMGQVHSALALAMPGGAYGTSGGSAGGGSNTSIQFNQRIYAAPGQSPTQIAKISNQQLNQRLQLRRA